MEGYFPQKFEEDVPISEVVMKVSKNRWSPEKGRDQIIKLIKLGAIQYEK